MSELKQCPFCGSDPVILDRSERDMTSGVIIKSEFIIHCKTCPCQLKWDSKAETSRLWNTRTYGRIQ